ncbi:purine-binding chemotaxis protein CheW [Agrobacterium sp. MOPV5]|uniref:chemotaxis protein CheW n=1 Tax=Agrobacterium leguminum TaxID=2792015 RepID=UPI0018C25286|nr:chemotaxis protein CheW [Agrobacterium leguminum]MBG0511599.1 purine-binding chemotaxis protein CheW [Agrobacterium leguminum]
MTATASALATTLEIIAFHLGDQQFCIKTTSIREIRGWAAATPLPHSPADVIGVMNLRGSVIPIIDLAARLGVRSTIDTSRAAIVVAEIDRNIVGLVVDQVSDILSIRTDQIQPVPDLGTSFDPAFSYGIIPLERGMVCFLNLDHMFERFEDEVHAA